MSVDAAVKAHPARERRLRFIESVICWEGSVQRQRVCDAMGVTLNHLTRDFTQYRALYPHNLAYDVTHRCYRPGPKFRPRVASGSPDEYLSLLRLNAEAQLAQVDPVPALPGPDAAAVVVPPMGIIDRNVLQALTRAIAQRGAVETTYQSLRKPDPVTRTLWPHALAFSGHRWHVRAYDAGTPRFGDFVIARFLEAKPVEGAMPPSEAAAPRDAEWQTEVTVDVVPNPNFTAAQQDAIAREYGMAPKRPRVWHATMRACMVGYFLRFHRLDASGKKERIALRDATLVKRYAYPDD